MNDTTPKDQRVVRLLVTGSRDATPYRARPQPIRLREREHASVCRWCAWFDGNGRCSEPRRTPSSSAHSEYLPWADQYNSKGQCRVYRPSVWTRVLQALGLRPFLERPRPDA